LLVRPWHLSPEPIVGALRAANVEPELEHVDFEAALHAAIARGPFDLAVYDPATPNLSRDVVESSLRDGPRKVPLIVMDGASSVVEHVRRVLEAAAS
jgi:hypothetical protein